MVMRAQQRMRHCVDRLGSSPVNGRGRQPGISGLAPPHELQQYEMDTQPDQLA